MGKTAKDVIEDLLGEYPDKAPERLAKKIIEELDKYGYRIIRHRVVRDQIDQRSAQYRRKKAKSLTT